jgi:inner membrane protein
VLLIRHMDSLSQIVLGAAVGEVLLGKKLGNKAQLLGAIGGTLPDLDVLLNPLFSDEITKLQIHRGYSHAIVIHLLLSFPLAKWCHAKWKDLLSFRRWYIFWASVLITHALLDCCTTYGTQLLLPFTDYLVGFNNISVVDPLWTIPFLLLMLVPLFLHRENANRIRWAAAACSYAGLYMLLTFYHKYTVHCHFERQLKASSISYHTLKTTPTMFNNVLWSSIAVSQDSLYFGEYSLLQEDPIVEWVAYPIHRDLIENHPDQRAMKALVWFGQGAYLATPYNDGIDFFTAKWGRSDFTQTEPHKAFVFHWRIEPCEDGWCANQIMPEWTKEDFNLAFGTLWSRILDKPKAVSQMQ